RRMRHTRLSRYGSSDVCSSDLGDKRGAALTAKSGGGLDGPEGCNFHQRSRSGSGLFARLAQVGDDTKRAFGLAGLADVAPVQNRSEEHRVGKGGGWGWAGGQ